MSRKKILDSSDVIVKGFAGRPGKLVAVGVRGNVIDAYGKDESSPMGFHADHVYRFNQHLFQKLQEAFSRGKTAELEQLWKTAELYRHEESNA